MSVIDLTGQTGHFQGGTEGWRIFNTNTNAVTAPSGVLTGGITTPRIIRANGLSTSVVLRGLIRTYLNVSHDLEVTCWVRPLASTSNKLRLEIMHKGVVVGFVETPALTGTIVFRQLSIKVPLPAPDPDSDVQARIRWSSGSGDVVMDDVSVKAYPHTDEWTLSSVYADVVGRGWWTLVGSTWEEQVSGPGGYSGLFGMYGSLGENGYMSYPRYARRVNVKANCKYKFYFDLRYSMTSALTTRHVALRATDGSYIQQETIPSTSSSSDSHVSYEMTFDAASDGEIYAVFEVDGPARLSHPYPSTELLSPWVMTSELGTSTYSNHGGLWKPANKLARHGGLWKPATQSVRHGGLWKQV